MLLEYGLTISSVSALLNASGLFNTITDYIILLLPMHAAWKLQLNRTKKLLVIAVFTFGLWYDSLGLRPYGTMILTLTAPPFSAPLVSSSVSSTVVVRIPHGLNPTFFSGGESFFLFRYCTQR
jgi:hypothetical protein